jgi:hypothetical protein
MNVAVRSCFGVALSRHHRCCLTKVTTIATCLTTPTNNARRRQRRLFSSKSDDFTPKPVTKQRNLLKTTNVGEKVAFFNSNQGLLDEVDGLNNVFATDRTDEQWDEELENFVMSMIMILSVLYHYFCVSIDVNGFC